MRANTIICILCRGIVAYTKKDRIRFNSHMSIEHGVSYSLNYILAGCLMNDDERNVVANIIEDREEKIDVINHEMEQTIASSEEEITVLPENNIYSSKNVQVESIKKRTKKAPPSLNVKPLNLVRTQEVPIKEEKYKRSNGSLDVSIVEDEDWSMTQSLPKMAKKRMNATSTEVKTEVNSEPKKLRRRTAPVDYREEMDVSSKSKDVSKVQETIVDRAEDISLSVGPELGSRRKRKCDHCGETFKNALQLSIHMIESHEEQYDESKKTNDKTAISELKPTLMEYSDLEVINENARTNPKEIGKSPLDENSKENSNSISCDHCGLRFLNKRSLWLHKKKHTEVSDKKSVFKTGGDNVETNKESKTSDVSSLVFSSNGGLPLNNSRDCKVCGDVLKDSDDLDKHMRDDHGEPPINDLPFKCDSCILIFSDKQMMERHKRINHSTKNSDGESLLLDEGDFVTKIRKKGSEENEANGDSSGMNKKRYVIRNCPYFEGHPQDIAPFKDDMELEESPQLPPDWRVATKIMASGRKILNFIHPDRIFSFRSRVAAFEYMKFEGKYSEGELAKYSDVMKIKKRDSVDGDVGSQ